MPFRERLQRDEHDARARAVREAVHRQPRERNRALDARLLQRDRAHVADHLLGAVERCTVRQLRERDQVFLVLRGHEAARHHLRHEHGRAHQHEVHAQHQRLARQHAAHAAAVVLRAAMEHLVEAAEEAAEHAVHHAREPVFLVAMALQQDRGQRRRQRQRVERRDHRRDRDGHRELLVELAGQARHERERHEHGDERQRDRDDRPAHFLHRLVGRLSRVHPAFDVALDVLDHHDRIVDHDPDREHHPEQRQRVDRIAERQQQRERADDRHRHRDQRNQRRAPGLQEHDHDDHDQRDRLEQRVHDRLDRRTHELRRVVDDLVVDARRHVLLQLGHRLAHFVGDLQRVRARRLVDRHRDGRLVVEQRTQPVLGCVELDPRDVAQARDAAVRRRLHDDVAELVFRLQAAARVHRQLQRRAGQRRRRADHAGRDLHVLFADRLHDVLGGQPALRDLLRIEPDAHRVVARSPQLHLADALDPRQAILHVDQRVVAQVGHVVAVVRRDQVDHHRQRRRAFHRRDAEPLHVFRQARQRLVHAVLHELRGLVRIGAELERDGDRHVAVAVRLRLHVEHVLDAVDLLLERRRDRLGDHFRVRARILRLHDHGRRHDLRIFRDRQQEHRDHPAEQDDHR
ncbi:hypothetical protein BPA30113_05478 [Burkholderia paludis]|uniref:Uncharacterized protein n=1 Tax=Burkholderia paludis TaxID=1506587 RepID=A0A6P2Q174_9BURK|nr:hypothetical protein LMG30113_01999 [Burkholderia paludis]VWC16151.1 hypothetical protein BPA30113_05478 [Burkholderia paludis]